MVRTTKAERERIAMTFDVCGTPVTGVRSRHSRYFALVPVVKNDGTTGPEHGVRHLPSNLYATTSCKGLGIARSVARALAEYDDVDWSSAEPITKANGQNLGRIASSGASGLAGIAEMVARIARERAAQKRIARVESSPMETQARAGVVKSAIMRAIQCAETGQILDVSDAFLITRRSGGAACILCGDAWRERCDGWANSSTLLEVWDGNGCEWSCVDGVWVHG